MSNSNSKIKFNPIEKINSLSKKTLLLLIFILSILVVVLIEITYSIYINRQQIKFSEIEPISMNELFEKSDLKKSKGLIEIALSENDLNSLLTYSISKTDTLSHIKNIYYDLNRQKLYLNIVNSKQYTFCANASITPNENNFVFELKNFKLGSFSIPITKGYFKKHSQIENSLSIPISVESRILELKDTKLLNEKLNIVYSYNPNKLTDAFNEYLKNIDTSRLALHKNYSDINSTFLNLSDFTDIDLDTALNCIYLFENDSQNIKEFSFLFNIDGIKKIYSDFNYIFIDNMSLNQWIELSENNLSQNLNQYHKTFSKYLLKYLYTNKDYKFTNSKLLVDEIPIEYTDIFYSFGYNDFIYDIDIKLEGKNLYAYYNVDGNIIKKIVFTRK